MRSQLRPPGTGESSGFTLIEVMIAIVLLSAAGLAAASAVIAVVKENDFSKRLAVATMLAQSQLDGLKNLLYTDASLTAGDHADPGNPLTVPGGGSYTRTWNVTDFAAPVEMKTVAVRVQWQSGRTRRAAVVTTMRAK